MAFCHRCGSRLPENSSFCPTCGTRTNHEQGLPQTCPACGQPLVDGCYFCVHCGYDLKTKLDYSFEDSHYSFKNSKKKRWIAFLLCVLFGVLGIHRFYEGKKWTGVLYFFTGGLFTIGVVYDLFRILFSSKFE